jgi:hypothetical protein
MVATLLALALEIAVSAVPVVERGIQAGETAVLHFQVRDRYGKVLADSERRGLPFRVRAGEDDFLARAALGLLPREERVMVLDAESLRASQLDRLLGTQTAVELRIRVAQIEPR